MIGTQKSKVYVVGERTFTELNDAKLHALERTLGDVPAAAEVMQHADEVLSILSQKPWKPRVAKEANAKPQAEVRSADVEQLSSESAGLTR